MNARDQRKLCMLGFNIIRRMDSPKPHIKIKCMGNPDNWKKYNGDYSSKAARDRVMTELLKNEYNVED